MTDISMNSQIKALFDMAIGYPIDQRQSVVEMSDFPEEVKQKVLRLLAVNVDEVAITGTIIDSVHIGLEIKPLTAGLVIDAYKLTESLGVGGQGEVWMAERITGDFAHQVAIKFLKPVHDAKELERFRNERRLLAQLKHNNIAQLIGGGELLSDSKHPRPYMILELVQGLPLIDYCIKHHFNLHQYLHIFLQICDAVSYAHSHLVIHRDIKPNNIIVTDDGVVKLLDFGIAKLLDDGEINSQTVPIMTLAYSSPEQVSGAPISTATDVYSLGLLLYELLTGQRAQAVQSEVPAELIHEITQKTPTTPSDVKVLAQSDRTYSNRQLKGDLDNLIMMALRKEPVRRYPSVQALANDVQNYLSGKPLMAAGDSRWYKVKKLISRSPVITTLSTLVVAFLVILPLVMYNSQLKLSQQRDAEIAARKEAQQQAIIANKTKDFLINILQSASPLGSQGEDINLQDVLNQSVRQLEHGLDDQLLLKAEMLNTLSSVYHHLGDNKKAMAFYRKSLPIYQQNNDLSGQVYTLGQMAVIAILDNEPLAASEYAAQAEVLSKQLTDAVEIAWHHSRMATWQGNMGQKAQAHETLLKTLELLKEQKVEDHELLGRIYNELAVTSVTHDDALNYIEQALYHADKDHGKIHPKYLGRLINKAIRLNRSNQNDQSEAIFLEASTIGEKLYASQHPEMAKLFGELAILYQDTGRFNLALNAFLKAIEIDKNISGIESLPYVFRTNNLGYLYEDMGDYQQAEDLFRESLRVRELLFSADPMRVATAKFNLSRVLAKAGHYDESEDLVSEVLPVFESKQRDITGVAIVRLANALGQQTTTMSCESVNDEIIRIKADVEKISEKSWRRMYHELWLGQLAKKCGLNQLAENLLQSALSRSKQIYYDQSEGQAKVAQTVQSLLTP